MSDKVKSFWENCDTTFAHITANKWLTDRETMISNFKIKIGPVDPTSKIIVDYGTGAGYFGAYLFEKFDITKYIGIDIAERSINAAKENLSDHDNTEFHLAPVDFSTLNADLFVSFAVIQHFPSKPYLDSFLNNLNNSGIKEVILQIRYGNKTSFNKEYKTSRHVAKACVTNLKYVSEQLTSYTCFERSSIRKDNKYQYLYFVKNQ